jgi:hypothetical protein
MGTANAGLQSLRLETAGGQAPRDARTPPAAEAVDLKLPPLSHLSASDAALLATIREWAKDPLAVFYSISGSRGKIASFPEDVIGKTDIELLAFITVRGRQSWSASSGRCAPPDLVKWFPRR